MMSRAWLFQTKLKEMPIKTYFKTVDTFYESPKNFISEI